MRKLVCFSVLLCILVPVTVFAQGGNTISRDNISTLHIDRAIGLGTADVMVWSPSESVIFVGGSLGIWSLDLGTLEFESILETDSAVVELALNPVAGLLLAILEDGRVISISGGGEVNQLHQSDGLLSLDPTGQTYAVLEFGEINIYQTLDNALVSNISEGLPEEQWNLFLGPGGNYVAVKGHFGDYAVYIWDLAHQRQSVLDLSMNPLSDLAFSYDGSMIGITTLSGRIFVAPLSTLAARTMNTAQRYGAGDIAFTYDGTAIAFEFGLRNIGIDTFAQQGFIENLHGDVRDIAFSPSGNYLAALLGGGVVVWDFETLTSQVAADGFIGPISSSQLLNDGMLAVSLSDDDLVQIIDLEVAEIESEVRLEELSSDLFYIDETSQTIIGFNSGMLNIYEISSGNLIHRNETENTLTLQDMSMSNLNPERVYLLVYDYSQRITSFSQIEAETGLEVWQSVITFESNASAFAISESENRVAFTWRDGSLQIYTLEGDSFSDPIFSRNFEDRISDFEFTSNGERLIFIQELPQFWSRVMAVDQSGEITNLGEVSWKVTSLFLDMENDLAFMGTDEGKLLVYDLEFGALILELDGHNREITSIYLSAEGTELITTSLDGTVRIWTVE